MRASSVISVETAQWIILLVGAAGMVFWMLAALFWLMVRKPVALPTLKRVIVSKTPQQARDMLPRAAALQEPMWDIIGGDANHAVFQFKMLQRVQVRVDVVPQNPGVRLQATQETAPQTGWMPWVMNLWLVAEPVIILAVGAVLWFTVAQSSSVQTRAQAFQMAQIAHIVWPPFLFLSIGKKARTLAQAKVERFLTTVELL